MKHVGGSSKSFEGVRFIHVSPHALLIGTAELMRPHSSFTKHPHLASHAFVELRCPNVAFKLLAITAIDSCRADIHPCPKQLDIRLHIMMIMSCGQ